MAMAKPKRKVNKKKQEARKTLQAKYDVQQKCLDKGMSFDEIGSYASSLLAEFRQKTMPYDSLGDIDEKITLLKKFMEEDGDKDSVIIVDSRSDNATIEKAIREAQAKKMDFIVVK